MGLTQVEKKAYACTFLIYMECFRSILILLSSYLSNDKIDD